MFTALELLVEAFPAPGAINWAIVFVRVSRIIDKSSVFIVVGAEAAVLVDAAVETVGVVVVPCNKNLAAALTASTV